MKKRYALLCLMLALFMLFTVACTEKNNNTDESGTKDDSSSAVIATVDSIWYSKANQTVVDLRNMPEIAVYKLQPGFYQFTKMIEGECVYEDYIVSLETEKETFSWMFDSQKGVLSANTAEDNSTYETRSALPSQYVSLAFPDFIRTDCKSLVTLPDYKNLKIEVNAERLAAVDIFQFYYETSEDPAPKITGRTAQAGDYVQIDYTGYLNGEAFENGAATGVDLLIDANSGYIPGFTEGIIGKEIGSTFDVPVKFPDNYHSTEMAGKSVIFKMTLHAIYDLSPIADEKIAKVTEGEFNTYSEMFDDYAHFYKTDEIQSKLIAQSTFQELPKELYEYFYQKYSELYHLYALYYGMEYEALLQYGGITEAVLLEDAKNEAKGYVLIYAIAQAENLMLSEDDFQTKLDDYFSDMEFTKEEIEEELADGGTETYHLDFTSEIVFDWILKQIEP